MCVRAKVCVPGRGARHRKHSPQGASLLSLSNGLKSSFNEYRVKLNGKSIMAIKAGRLQPARVCKVNKLSFDDMGQRYGSKFSYCVFKVNPVCPD